MVPFRPVDVGVLVDGGRRPTGRGVPEHLVNAHLRKLLPPAVR
jgi:hypothetical protein